MYKLIKNVVDPFNTCLLTPSKLKLVNFLVNQLLVSLRIVILVNFEAKWSRTRILKGFKRPFLESIIDQFLLQMCQNTRNEWDYESL